MKAKKYIIIGVLIGVISLSIPLVAFAKQVQAQNNSDNSTIQNSNAKSSSNSAENSNAIQAQSGKLEGNNLKACQNRETVINNIMARVVNRGEKQLLVLDAISTRLQTFYTTKAYALNNYDELVSAVSQKRVETQNMVQTMAQNGTEFNCEGDSPKAVANSFQEKVTVQNNTLKEYKNAINDLLIAIKTAANNSEVTE